jgi:hypothetical protein
LARVIGDVGGAKSLGACFPSKFSLPSYMADDWKGKASKLIYSTFLELFSHSLV